ncbi:hypothetical protein EDF56_102443 [Novosphingobium sp. PhB165]|nr:hypothetical protein EDF56_102443 [Novosphingobium sp. PhB165]
MIMLCLLVAGLLVASLASTEKGDGYLVVVPPGWTLGRTTGLIRASGGRLVRPGGFSNIVIAASTDPRFGRALKRAGAVFVRRVPGPLGCTAPQKPSTAT